ncbi:carotenoid oxygenase family protein [Bathymodiolus thermophilus thioautotrophic gill symbiont]|uniref:Lignostilbene-alpha,beta-dioxygenase and related enzymes n=1 Tax=Bathymodiolus thermophilus thioautotrophic gill symbiont TaxID=2360 RepID=A0A8H8XCD6_9GAMM|nr:carotenoid oxygenase family protein [Bathymodiolus thermophilus thioautotrophic gill symbiont]CAB5499244.1 Lignostilbene-alpha,beta-dioxygenase and related enzymes [Bathymodiolus thermophilus thioautotrophic gill symbiont]
MNRREFIQSTSGLALSSLVFPHLSFAQQEEWTAAFNRNLKIKPWLLGWQGTNQAVLQTGELEVKGKIPQDLTGYFYRNGPAQNEVYGKRYHHWFDGDGMVQKFHIVNGKISHFGKMVDTHKYLTEKQQQKMLFQTFSTYLPKRISSADEINVANISLLPLNNRLFALWEGGSAYEINPKNLKTIGIQSWSPQTKGLPFGAHYRQDQNGSIWNIGYASLNDAIVLWHLDNRGKLKQFKSLPIKNVPMVHDFMITKKYLVLLLPSFRFDKTKIMAKRSFLDAHYFDKQQASIVWLIDKNTLDIQKTFELPAQFVFHFVNAYEQGNEVIFDSMRYPNADIFNVFTEVMQGVDNKFVGAYPYRVRLNLEKNTATEEKLSNIYNEFPSVDIKETGLAHTQVVSLQQRGELFFNSVAINNYQTGTAQHFSYTKQLAEEHLLIKDARGNDWVIGTTLDYEEKCTKVNIFKAKKLNDGPVAVAKLPYVLPLGLHGKFINL